MKPANNLFEQLNIFEKQIKELDQKIKNLESNLNERIIEVRHQIVRVKNKQSLTDDFILSGKRYLDLSPSKAFDLYHSRDFDFIMLDVSEDNYVAPVTFTEAIKIPWSDFTKRFHEIQTHTTPILVISEDGVTSILACHFLAEHGFLNTNNVSGGYKYWRGL